MVTLGYGRCACGRHETQLDWCEDMRRAAAVAFISFHYGEIEEARERLGDVLRRVPERCDSPLAQMLREWREDGRPQRRVLPLARALCHDADHGVTRRAS